MREDPAWLDEVIESIPTLRALPVSERRSLLARSQRRVVGRDDEIWRESRAADHFVFALRGRAKLSKGHPAGHQVTVSLAGAGELLCGAVHLLGGSYCCSANGMTADTELLFVPRDALLDALSACPGALRPFLASLGCRTQVVCSRAEDLSSGSVERRAARLFLRLIEATGTHGSDGSIYVPIRMSRADLADLCATTTETIIRVMRALELKGLIHTLKDGFEVADRSALTSLVRGGRRTTD